MITEDPRHIEPRILRDHESDGRGAPLTSTLLPQRLAETPDGVL
jgi:hypothetical protein